MYNLVGQLNQIEFAICLWKYIEFILHSDSIWNMAFFSYVKIAICYEADPHSLILFLVKSMNYYQ